MASKRLLPLLLSRALRQTARSAVSSLTHSPLTHHPQPRPQQLIPPSHLRPYSSSPPPQPPKTYTFEDIQHLSTTPSPSRLLIDVREPAELLRTGRIPNSVSMPITSHPDAVYLPPDDFHDRFGFAKPSGSPSRTTEEEEGEPLAARSDGGESSSSSPKPYTAGHGGADVGAAAEAEADGEDDGEGDARVQEVVFFCKAGVRSRAAMQMALGQGGWRGMKIGQWSGGWDEWERRGGKVER